MQCIQVSGISGCENGELPIHSFLVNSEGARRLGYRDVVNDWRLAVGETTRREQGEVRLRGDVEERRAALSCQEP